jgi:hypothetical protein
LPKKPPLLGVPGVLVPAPEFTPLGVAEGV